MQSRNVRRQIRRPRYRVIGGVPSIELKLRSPRQLFDERDPAPFRERDLDDDAVRYIVSSFRELKDQQDVKVQLYFESLGEFESNPKDIARALHQFFRYESDMKRRDLRGIFHQGLISLAIGLTFLFLCTWFAFGFEPSQAKFWQSFVHEGLLVVGWCSMWKPISIFLHEWWPIADEVLTLNRLADVDVEVAVMKPVAVPTTTAPQAPAVASPAPLAVTSAAPGATVVLPVVSTSLTPPASSASPSTPTKKDYALA